MQLYKLNANVIYLALDASLIYLSIQLSAAMNSWDDPGENSPPPPRSFQILCLLSV